MRDARRRLETVGPPKVRSAEDFSRISLPAADCDVLRDLLVSEEVQTVVEIGLAYGASALAIAEALLTGAVPRPRHLVIDPFQDHFHRSGCQILTDAGWTDFCDLIEERSQTALPRLLSEGLVVDAAFVDRSHLFHHVFVDLFHLNELVRPNGIVVLDDVDWPSVAGAARYFEVDRGWEPMPIGSATRLGSWRTPDR